MAAYYVSGYLPGGCVHVAPISRARAAKMLRKVKAGMVDRWLSDRGTLKVRELSQQSIKEFPGFAYERVTLTVQRSKRNR